MNVLTLTNGKGTKTYVPKNAISYFEASRFDKDNGGFYDGTAISLNNGRVIYVQEVPTKVREMYNEVDYLTVPVSPKSLPHLITEKKQEPEGDPITDEVEIKEIASTIVAEVNDNTILESAVSEPVVEAETAEPVQHRTYTKHKKTTKSKTSKSKK